MKSTSSKVCLLAILAGMCLLGGIAADAQSRRVGVKVVDVNGRLQAISDAGTAVGDIFVYSNGQPSVLMGPLARGVGTSLVAVNSHGQVLVAQKFGPLRYFLYDPTRKDFTSIGLAAQISDSSQPVQLVYLTGLDDSGRVFGAFARGQSACAAVGKPTLGTSGDLGPAPSAPANFELIGCPGPGAIILSANAKGQIAGNYGKQGFIWSEGKLAPFAFPGSLATQVTGMNGSGVVVGNFLPGYPVSADGVITPDNQPGQTLQTGYIYDGHDFRYVTLPGISPAADFGGINNRGQIVGYYTIGEDKYRSFIGEVDSFPVVRMLSSTAALLSAAVDRKLAAGRTASAGGGIDQAYRILQTRVGQRPASTLRALQALGSTGALSAQRIVQTRVENASGMGQVNYDSPETLRGRVIDQLLNSLMAQLSAIAGTAKGIDTVIDAVDALAGDQGLQDLRAAGELAPSGPAVLNSPSNQFTPATRAKFKMTLASAIAAHPIEVESVNLELWQDPKVTPKELKALAATLRDIKQELGEPAADIFLARSTIPDSNVSDLLAWQVADRLLDLKSQGDPDRAEQILRALARTPESAAPPGLGPLRASGTHKDDAAMAATANPWRAQLADAISGIVDQRLHSIYSEPANNGARAGVATTDTASISTSAPPTHAPSDSTAATEQSIAPSAKSTVSNDITSPAGPAFYGRNAIAKDATLTFTLIAPSDFRNGQTLSFKGLVPLPDQGGRAWITSDRDGFVIFSMSVPGSIMGQVLPKAAGESLYEKAARAQP